MGKQKFHSKLDELTQAAAKVENCDGQYNLFNQVIEFDDKKQVFYFPSLWKGNPPMASVNTGYSESAQILQTTLIELTQYKKTCRCTLETFKLRVQQIWQAVLEENFVFSFKNTLEVYAYNELDSQYAQWSWHLRSKMLEWENETKLEIDNYDTENDEIKSKVEDKIRHLKVERDKISEKKSEIKRTIIEEEIQLIADSHLETAKATILQIQNDTIEKMKKFLDTAKHSDTLLQWKHKTEKKIKELHDENRKKAESFCEELLTNKLNHVEVDHQEVVNLVKINSDIRKLVNESWKKTKKYSDEELEEIFEDKWITWMGDCKTKTVEYPSPAKIDTAIVTILRELMEADDALIINKLTKTPFNQRSSSMKFKIDKSIHLSSTKWFNFGSIENKLIYSNI